MLKFEGCTFSAAGESKNSKLYGLTVTGSEDVEIRDCTFNGTGYSALLNQGTGNLSIKDCVFACGNIKNPIEGSQTIDNGNYYIENCIFEGIPGNNFINIYNVAPESTHTIKNCKFHGGTGNNIIRLSNKNNAVASFNIIDCMYEFISGKVDEWTGFLLCQDYTNKSGNKQEFGYYTININNLAAPDKGALFYVYDDGEGIITTNDPYVYVDGTLVSDPTVQVFYGTAPDATGFQEGPDINF